MLFLGHPWHPIDTSVSASSQGPGGQSDSEYRRNLASSTGGKIRFGDPSNSKQAKRHYFAGTTKAPSTTPFAAEAKKPFTDREPDDSLEESISTAKVVGERLVRAESILIPVSSDGDITF